MKIRWGSHHSLNNEKGQVAIFVALIFQVLFLFFAMVINVGLLVHHKINLQNSVDLAAYYGAAKQAENLNVIAHMNYQIRQSWKLLVFRYRQLGTAGETDSGGSNHPYNKMSDTLVNPTESSVASRKEFMENPAFCITYQPFQPMPDGENTCRDSAEKSQSVALFQPPAIIAGFQGFSIAIRAATEALLNKATTQCKKMGSYNFILLGNFVAAYNIDQESRMSVIQSIANSMSESDSTFIDVDGGDVRQGMIATLKNNLTAPNAASLEDTSVTTVNSLGSGACASKGGGDFPRWLSPIKIMPGFSYIDTKCNGQALVTEARELSAENLPYEKESGGMIDTIRQLTPWMGMDPSNIFAKYNLSLGVEKNPWCMAYVGVKATTEPKIPFSPLGTIKLTARAIAKPFAGRIGPWYGKFWPQGAEFSNSPTGVAEAKTDTNIPPRMTDTSIFTNPKGFADPFRSANYSRFVGDPYGYKSRLTLGYFGQAVHRLREFGTDGSSPNFFHWAHLPFFDRNGANDILAWNGALNKPSDMRFLELMSILPDQFDVTYYSIEPNYYDSYFTRLQKGLGARLNIANKIRPDLGHRSGTELDKFSIRHQFDQIKRSDMFQKLKFEWKTEFLWALEDYKNLFTSWSPTSLVDFNINSGYFGRCVDNIEDGEVPSPGSCVQGGGTTGYSVKLVAKEFLLRSDLKLGGEGTQGSITNPPPDGF